MLFWLSFCDTRRPKGTQFLGACIVEADDFKSACREAWRLKINPGGDVQGHPILSYIAPYTRPWAGRLLTKEEALAVEQGALTARMQAEGVTGEN